MQEGARRKAKRGESWCSAVQCLHELALLATLSSMQYCMQYAVCSVCSTMGRIMGVGVGEAAHQILLRQSGSLSRSVRKWSALQCRTLPPHDFCNCGGKLEGNLIVVVALLLALHDNIPRAALARANYG